MTNENLENVTKRLSKLSKANVNRLFAIWMNKERINLPIKTTDLMFSLDSEWYRIYKLNIKDGLSTAALLANERILTLIYGD